MYDEVFCLMMYDDKQVQVHALQNTTGGEINNTTQHNTIHHIIIPSNCENMLAIPSFTSHLPWMNHTPDRTRDQHCLLYWYLCFLVLLYWYLCFLVLQQKTATSTEKITSVVQASSKMNISSMNESPVEDTKKNDPDRLY